MSFLLTSGRVIITDPYKDINGAGQAIISNVKIGCWRTHLQSLKHGSIFTAFCEHVPTSTHIVPEMTTEVDCDSGYIGLFDYHIFEHWRELQSQIENISDVLMKFYANTGIVAYSGYEDGRYNTVLYRDTAGYVVTINIHFFRL